MNTAITMYKDFDNLERAARALWKSGYFSDAKSEAQAIVKVMAGSELGLPAFASMSGIHIIQGKPTLGSNVIATLVKNDPRYDYHVKQADDKVCILEWYEDGNKVGEAGFTIQEAQGAGLTGKDNWKKYTSDMLFARAISRGARRFAPGIFGGSPVYTPDEMGADTDKDGYIDAASITVEQTETLGDYVDATLEDAGPEALPEPMTIEKACAITNSEGTPYGEIDSDKLSLMTIGINKGLANGITDEKRKVYEEKLSAIKVILQARNDGSI
jgi:hypothetical protein